MDTTKLEILEQHIQQLLAILTQVKAENARLSQRLAALQKTGQEQVHPDWEAAQAELVNLRTMIHALRQERELIRAKLETMLGTVERLEVMASPATKP
ncbi:MAG: hypothetical protein AB7N91_21565 [Candidatus Tectimicrobiota bacterium]